ncbi:15739_t:CDS:2, partial [Acaulospora colombiana]
LASSFHILTLLDLLYDAEDPAAPVCLAVELDWPMTIGLCLDGFAELLSTAVDMCGHEGVQDVGELDGKAKTE